MPTEIEHKYLVKSDKWKNLSIGKSYRISQGYLMSDPDKTVRVRTKGDKGFITIKGKTVNASRPEFEYEIPLKDAEDLLKNFCSALVEKTRHIVIHENKTWEIDEFKGANKGLIIAEIELASEDEHYSIPDWVNENVTSDHRYSNSNLAVRPFGNW